MAEHKGHRRQHSGGPKATQVQDAQNNDEEWRDANEVPPTERTCPARHRSTSRFGGGEGDQRLRTKGPETKLARPMFANEAACK